MKLTSLALAASLAVGGLAIGCSNDDRNQEPAYNPMGLEPGRDGSNANRTTATPDATGVDGRTDPGRAGPVPDPNGGPVGGTGVGSGGGTNSRTDGAGTGTGTGAGSR